MVSAQHKSTRKSETMTETNAQAKKQKERKKKNTRAVVKRLNGWLSIWKWLFIDMFSHAFKQTTTNNQKKKKR